MSSLVIRRGNASMAERATQAPRVPWDVFVTQELQWKNGEHFGLIGPTGLGKTTMLTNILSLHPYVVVFATKPRDKTMEGLIASGYLKMKHWRSLSAVQFPRRVLWPDASKLDSETTQKKIFLDALAKIYREGGWTVALDETWYMDNKLKLGGEIKTYLLQARSLGISLVTATQRPAWVPREIYTSCTHLAFWRVNDETDLKNISGIGWRSGDLIRSVVADLDLYEILYINTRTGQMLRTKCPPVSFPERKTLWSRLAR